MFDGDDENKLVYTEIHNEFKRLVESLLQSQLADLNVTDEQFVKACHIKASNIFDQILSVDNFVAFKKLMVKKNKELYLEAYNLLEQEGRINPKVTENINPVNINKQPEVNKISEELKKEVEINFEKEKTKKIVSI